MAHLNNKFREYIGKNSENAQSDIEPKKVKMGKIVAKKSKKILSVVSCNARSLIFKRNKLRDLIELNDISIAQVCETWYVNYKKNGVPNSTRIKMNKFDKFMNKLLERLFFFTHQ